MEKYAVQVLLAQHNVEGNDPSPKQGDRGHGPASSHFRHGAAYLKRDLSGSILKNAFSTSQ
jgi:hypothetical protein